MSELIFGWTLPEEKRPVGFLHHVSAPSHAPTAVTDAGDGHAMVIAPTGAGKGRSIAIPNLLTWDGPAIAIDLKGELATTTARYRRSVLNQKVVILDPWKVVTNTPDALNPLDLLLGLKSELADECFKFASMLGGPTGRLRDPFWEERGQSLIAGLMALVAFDDEPSGLKRIYDLLHADDTVYALAVILDTNKKMPGFARQQIAGFLSTVEITRSGILSTAMNLVRFLGGELVGNATRPSTFDLTSITRGEAVTIYIVVPPANLVSHAALIRLWVSTLLSLITQRTRRPGKPTLFVMDEIAQLGPMPQVLSAVTLGRSYGLRCMLFLQSYAQLRSLYPHDHDTLLENCASVATFGHTSRTMSMQIASAIGDRSAETLYRMDRGSLAVRCNGEEMCIVRKLDYLTDPLLLHRAEANPMFRQERAL